MKAVSQENREKKLLQRKKKKQREEKMVKLMITPILKVSNLALQ